MGLHGIISRYMGNIRCLTRRGKIYLRFFTRFLCYASVLCAGVTLCVPDSYGNDQQALESVQQDIAIKERQVRQQQRRHAQLQQQLKKQEQEIAVVGRMLHETQQRLAQIVRQIAELNATVMKLQQQQYQEKQQLARQLDAAFRLGQHSDMQSFFAGEDGQRQQRLRMYYQYINQQRQQSIQQLQHTQQQWVLRKQELQSSQKLQQKLLTEQQAQQEKFSQARDSRKKTLEQLASSIQRGQQQLAQLRQNERRLRDSIVRAEAAAREYVEREAREAQQVRTRQQQAAKSGGNYKVTDSERALMARTGGLGKPAGQNHWPIKGALLHRYSDLIQGELRWKGIVIAANAGSEVKSIADGRVILVDWLQGYGLVIVLEHGKGDMSLYGYNQSALVKVGDSVHTGQPVALVGDSGGQGQSALYFEIRRQGQAVNPLPWLGQ